jgi:hypothetical protein
MLRSIKSRRLLQRLLTLAVTVVTVAVTDIGDSGREKTSRKSAEKEREITQKKQALPRLFF